MAKVSINVDVEYARILMFGVWFELSEVYDLMSQLNEIMAPRGWLPKEQQWWVYNHDSNMKVVGPFSSSTDAGQARGILEQFDKGGNINYWVQQEK